MTPAVRAGSLANLGGLLDRLGAKRVLLVTGRASYTAAKPLVDAATDGRDVLHMDDFEANPKEHQLLPAVAAARDFTPDVVVAIGGGTPLDMAKMINVFHRNNATPRDVTRGAATFTRPGVPLVAVPTTAGSGSEATQFAVLYIDGQKHSIDHPHLLPSHVILDPDLLASMPAALAASTGIDAVAQAIESYWAAKATPASQRLAAAALEYTWPAIMAAACGDAGSRAAMLQGAHLAGQAIQHTRTTAAHALSYGMTTRYGIPHGHAVGVTLGEFLALNDDVTAATATHPGGPTATRDAMADIYGLLGVNDGQHARDAWYARMDELGLAHQWPQLGVAADDVPALAAGVPANRLGNNPRAMQVEDLVAVLRARL